MGLQARALEDLAVNADFWRRRRVMVTGHTGFKGGWLSLWLQKLGSTVAGYSLPPPSEPSLFELAAVGERMESVLGDLRDSADLQNAFARFKPEVVFHLAAQPLVRKSYAEPAETFHVNVMGTVHVLEAVRRTPSCRAIINVTSDKCYENKEWVWGYREDDLLGGHDPYSSSKACAEIVTAAYRRSFFETQDSRRVALASARAGNVIGGGDFSQDRIIPDLIRAMKRCEPLYVRNPDAVRPWQHVLEPLAGYLLLAEKLWERPVEYARSWNFGPAADDIRPVRWLVERLSEHWAERVSWKVDATPRVHEAHLLMLDSTKARMLLGWKPRWTLERTLLSIVEWHDAHANSECLRDVVTRQIDAYEASIPA